MQFYIGVQIEGPQPPGVDLTREHMLPFAYWITLGRWLPKHYFDPDGPERVADGVPQKDLYPLDIKRALSSLNKVKKNINVWWTSGAQNTQLLQSGEIDLIDTWGARAYAAGFGFRGTDQQKKVKDLSGGERNRLHLATLLKSGGNLLLLDEPTNDLDVDTLRSLEEALLSFGGCAVVISHDRWFLDRIATHILAFEGDSKTVWCEGNFQTYEAQRKQRLGVEADQPHRIKYRKLHQ